MAWTSSRASMQATTATFLAGGSGRSPLSKDSAYASLLRSRSSVTLMREQNTRKLVELPTASRA